MDIKILKSRKASVIIGAALIIIAILSVIFLKSCETKEEPVLVRPLKTMLIQSGQVGLGKKYPGKVSAKNKADLAFQVDGPLVELPVKKGQDVSKGTLIAKIDPRDFQSALDAATAQFKKAEVHLERVQKAVKTGAISKTDLTNAEASFETAQAKLKTATKALEDTVIHANFEGVIADIFVENFENVKAKQIIASLQDVNSLLIEVSVPEERIALGKGDKGKLHFTAAFDYLPGREFDVELDEFTAQADPLTQTYTASFVMEAPKDLSILPGMTATIIEHPKEGDSTKPMGFRVPLKAVPIDGLGNYYLWKVKTAADGTMTVHKADVKVGEMSGDEILVVEGLAKGDRIAIAGVSFLQEAQQVKLYKPDNTRKD